MPRVVFRLASDKDNMDVDCYAFGRVNGRPYCDACDHPYCLAPGGSPEGCKFRKTRDEFYATQHKRKRKEN